MRTIVGSAESGGDDEFDRLSSEEIRILKEVARDWRRTHPHGRTPHLEQIPTAAEQQEILSKRNIIMPGGTVPTAPEAIDDPYAQPIEQVIKLPKAVVKPPSIDIDKNPDEADLPPLETIPERNIYHLPLRLLPPPEL